MCCGEVWWRKVDCDFMGENNLENEFLIPKAYEDRIREIVNVSWKILLSQYTNGKIELNKEAPFQLHFASILKDIGQLYAISPEEIFFINLETKCEGIKGKSKYLDVTFGFRNKIRCSMELKFKTEKQGAQDHGRIDAFIDIEALELSLTKNYDKGFFAMITDSTVYINKSKKGVGTHFPLHNGAEITPGQYHCDSKGREKVFVTLKNHYKIKWNKFGDKYFLLLEI